MNSTHDIIMLALPRWDAKYSSTSFSLATTFSKTNRVFYIDNPFTIKDFLFSFNTQAIKKRIVPLLFGRRFSRKINTLPENFVAVTTPLVFPINFLPPGKIYDFFAAINDRIVYNTIRKTIKKYKIDNFIYINSFNALFGKSFPKDFKPDLLIYHSVDDVSQSVYVSKHGSRLEAEFIKGSDIVIATSLELTRKIKLLKEEVFHLPNAADIGLFKKAISEDMPTPGEIKGIKKKIIGYTGNIDIRLDYKLLKNIALSHPDKVVVLVGPFGSDDYKKFGLDKVPNVIFTGAKNIKELPAYLQKFSCSIIPFRCNKLTKSIYPLKINEYLAAGKPVVATAFSGDIENFKDVIYLAADEQAFIELIDKAILEDSQENVAKRSKFSESNTWEARAATFWKIVGGVLEESKESKESYSPA